MKDCNGKEIKIGDSVKFVCTLEDLSSLGILEDHGNIIINSVGSVCRKTPYEALVEVYIEELGDINYWFNDNMVKVI